MNPPAMNNPTSLPGPPVLKTTIIQLNKDLDNDDKNYEILTNEYTLDQKDLFVEELLQPQSAATKKKRRRLSANVDSEELAKRKSETKQLHLIIEKRRRIKINREFEALKFLIPACRTLGSNATALVNVNKKPAPTLSANGSKIDGMYKLTILKLLVEYILYLHHIIKQQHTLLRDAIPQHDFAVDFAEVALDVNRYRDIDKEFNFKALAEGLDAKELVTSLPPVNARIEEEVGEDLDEQQLPSPDVTPNMAPILLMLKKYGKSGLSGPEIRLPIWFLNPLSTCELANTSPLTIPLKTSGNDVPFRPSVGFKPREDDSRFALPDAALADPESQVPRKKYFKSRPSSEIILNPGLVKLEQLVDLKKSFKEDQDALKTLLALRKSSIDSLLN